MAWMLDSDSEASVGMAKQSSNLLPSRPVWPKTFCHQHYKLNSPPRFGEGPGEGLTLENRNIVIGQKIDSGKVSRAKELRGQMTPAEKLLWQQLRANRLHGFHFRRQQLIDGFIVDFYCHKAALIVEIDGPIHESQEDYDADREQILSKRGLLTLRFKNEDVFQNLNSVLKSIAMACKERT